MSKGSLNRSISQKFKEGYGRIKWANKSAPSRFAPKPRTRSNVHHIMLDIDPYKAVGGADAGKMITSRSHEREYLKRNNCIQVGNEKDTFFRHNGKTDDNPTKGW